MKKMVLRIIIMTQVCNIIGCLCELYCPKIDHVVRCSHEVCFT